MAGASEVIQTIGAIIIFSLIILTSNRMIQESSTHEVESETENMAVSLAQDIIEESQTKAFDEATTNNNIPKDIPDDFSAISSDGESRANFDDFDDYDGYTETVNSGFFGSKSFKLQVKVAYVSPSNNYDIDKGSSAIPTNYKKIQVSVTSDYLKNNQEIKLSYLRRYYKTKHP